MTALEPRIEALGEAALLVTLADAIDPGANAIGHALAAAVEAARGGAGPAAGLGRAVPAHASVLVPFDPGRLDGAAAERLVRELVPGAIEAAAAVVSDERPPIEIPVRYDGADLAEVAERCGLDVAEVIELHAGTTYRVTLLGFAPGFAYLGPLPAALALPRRATPRERVPAGSVAIAGEQTAIYPSALPGGWHLLGRTGMRLWDLARPDRPSLLGPGDRVRFVAIR